MHRISLSTSFTGVCPILLAGTALRSITTTTTPKNGNHNKKQSMSKGGKKKYTASSANSNESLTTTALSPAQIEVELFKANIAFFEARRKMLVHEEEMKKAHELVVTSKLQAAVAQAAIDLDLFAEP